MQKVGIVLCVILHSRKNLNLTGTNLKEMKELRMNLPYIIKMGTTLRITIQLLYISFFNSFLEKQAFLQRTDIRQFEQERDVRLKNFKRLT